MFSELLAVERERDPTLTRLLHFFELRRCVLVAFVSRCSHSQPFRLSTKLAWTVHSLAYGPYGASRHSDDSPQRR